MKKILLICVTSQNVITFRRGLISKLQSDGYTVSVVAFDDEYRADIEALGVIFYCINDKNRSINPLKILSLKRKYCKVIREVDPDVVFTFMLKPNTFGVLAAKKCGVKAIYSMVEGAGDVFQLNSLKWKIIRAYVFFMYRRALKYPKFVLFLNNDDPKDFVANRLVDESRCMVINGIGVDLERFEQQPLTNNKTFLMIARMLKTKGVIEYCECARRVKARYPDAVFNYVGAEGNVTLLDIQEYLDDESVNYLGTTKDVRPFIGECTAFVLPSHREGLPMSTMEAESVGRMVLTCDTTGCRDTVSNGYNGFLIPQGNVDALVEKCCWVLENPDEVKKMGENSRRFAEDRFDQNKINALLCDLLKR